MKIFVLLLFSLFVSASLAEPRITDKVIMTFSVDGQIAGDLEIGLFGEVVPKTVKNFVTLCQGDQKMADSDQTLSYEGSKIHRIVPDFIIQDYEHLGGDFTRGDGKGGMSIYGGKFDDENFEIKHFEGCISMANAGPNTNGSQFFFSLAENSWLDGIHVVFGKVLKNMELLKKIEGYGNKYGTPSASIVIEKCKWKKNHDYGEL